MHKNCLIEFSIYCICVIDLSTHHAVTPNMFKKKNWKVDALILQFKKILQEKWI